MRVMIILLVFLPSSCDQNTATRYECQGAVLPNSSLCPGDDTGLTAEGMRVAVERCTAETSCEYQCHSNYVFDNGACVPDEPAATVCEATNGGRCFYIAPEGDDLNDGSILAPFASTNPVIDTIEPGDFIYFRGGEYGSNAKG
ncbi:hypothetical protein KJ865_01770, partial [Myxococcota bacterium]|nr:hypothetical protein [Myxococcota bacterium]